MTVFRGELKKKGRQHRLDLQARVCNNVVAIAGPNVAGMNGLFIKYNKRLGVEGFLPMSRASFMLDFIVLAMAAIVPLLLLSVYLVRRKRKFALHRRIQITLGVVLGLAIVAFELDMRIFGWRQYAEPSPYFQTLVFPALYVHLCFAVPTFCLWVYTLAMALRHSISTEMNPHRIQHKRWGLWSALGMLGTTFSGCLFFWLAFMA